MLNTPAHGISSGSKGQVSKGHKQESTLTVQPASVAGTRLGAVGAAAERGRSGTENPCEDGCTSGAAGFLHDVLDALFDRSAALTSAHSSLTAIGSTPVAAFPFSACVIFLLSSQARRFMCIR